MSELSEKVINNLIERNANLEFELEKKQEIIDNAIAILKDFSIDNAMACRYALEILQEKEVKKSKEK